MSCRSLYCRGLGLTLHAAKRTARLAWPLRLLHALNPAQTSLWAPDSHALQAGVGRGSLCSGHTCRKVNMERRGGYWPGPRTLSPRPTDRWGVAGSCVTTRDHSHLSPHANTHIMHPLHVHTHNHTLTLAFPIHPCTHTHTHIPLQPCVAPHLSSAPSKYAIHTHTLTISIYPSPKLPTRPYPVPLHRPWRSCQTDL